MNFYGSIRGASEGARFVIRDAESRLLGAGDYFLHEPSIPDTELGVAALMGII